MSRSSKIFDLVTGAPKITPDDKPNFGIPFDKSRVTELIKIDLMNNIRALPDVSEDQSRELYDAALQSILAGGNLKLLYDALMHMNIDGMTKKRAKEVTLPLFFKATALIIREHQQLTGIKCAAWCYSGAPCQRNPKKPTAEDIRQDAAHRAANNQRYETAKGMFVDGKWTWPGREEGCKCFSKPFIEGIGC